MQAAAALEPAAVVVVLGHAACRQSHGDVDSRVQAEPSGGGHVDVVHRDDLRPEVPVGLIAYRRQGSPGR